MRALVRRGVMLCLALLLVAGPSAAQPETEAADPPGRVGRIARISATVSYRPTSAADWEPAALNQPLTTGAGLWTEPRAGADVEVGASRIVLEGASNLEFESLDDRGMVMVLPQGGAYLRLRDILAGETVQVRTPRGLVTIGQPGAYVIQAGDAAGPTLVTVITGAAQVYGPGVSLLVPARTTATLTGEGTFQAVLGPARPGTMAEAEYGRERPIPQGPDAPPPILAQMTGGEALLETGNWESVPEYGQVWYPPVAVGWVPYRHGRWSFVAPWGWTWIDEAPWGFAPFHYGRWRQFGPRWGWIPVAPGIAYHARPVYAPALVAFVGFGAGVATGLAINRPVGWVPLGPREVYRPPYRASPAHFGRLNQPHVPNFQGAPQHGPDGYVNRRGATAVPAGAIERSQPVARVAQPMPQVSLGAAQFVPQPGLRPVPAAVRPIAPGPAPRPMPQMVPPVPGRMPAVGAGQPPPFVPGISPPPIQRPMPQVIAPQPRPAFAPPPQVPQPGFRPPAPPPMAAPQPRPAFAPPPQVQQPSLRPSAPPPMAAPQPRPAFAPPPQVQQPIFRPSAPPPMAAPQPRPQPAFSPPPQRQAPPPQMAPPPQRHCQPGRPGC